MDFDKEKKILIDHWHVLVTPAMGFIGFTAGGERHAFIMPPSGTKTFATTLIKNLEKIEAEHGEVDTSTSTVSQMSPIQPGTPGI